MRPRTHQRTYCWRRIPDRDMQTTVRQWKDARGVGKDENIEKKKNENSKKKIKER